LISEGRENAGDLALPPDIVLEVEAALFPVKKVGRLRPSSSASRRDAWSSSRGRRRIEVVCKQEEELEDEVARIRK